MGISSTERLRPHMEPAAGNKASATLSLFLEADELEVEKEMSTMATTLWREGVWMNRWIGELQKAWRKQIF